MNDWKEKLMKGHFHPIAHETSYKWKRVDLKLIFLDDTIPDPNVGPGPGPNQSP